MRIVVDLQGVQVAGSLSAQDASLALALALARNRGEHELIIVLNAFFSETIVSLRALFTNFIPLENIRIWQGLSPISTAKNENLVRYQFSAQIYEAFIASLAPDLIHVFSFFEGYESEALINFKSFDVPILINLPSLESLLQQVSRLKSNVLFEQYYLAKIKQLKQAALCITCSDSEKELAVFELSLEKDKVSSMPMLSGAQNEDLLVWDERALCLLICYEKFAGFTKSSEYAPSLKKPKLAFVSPLPPEQTGIADYCAQLLPALAVYYDIELVVEQKRVNSRVSANFKIRDGQWLIANASTIDRVLYHFGNSPFHVFMLPLLRQVPGVVVLHDFFLGNLYNCLGLKNSSWLKLLYEAHGYLALSEGLQENLSVILKKYPLNLTLLQQAQGIIVHSKHAQQLAKQYYGESIAQNWSVVPLLRTSPVKIDTLLSRKILGLAADDFVVCSFGFISPAKLNMRLAQAWLHSCFQRNFK